MMTSFGERKLIFIESLSFSFFFKWRKSDTPNVKFDTPNFFQSKNICYRK